MRFFVFLLMFAFGLMSCTKTEVERIPNNEPPPDPTISKEAYQRFVVRSYISIIGRAPSQAQLMTEVAALDSGKFSEASRAALIDRLLNTVDFRINTYDLARAELLNNLDTAAISQEIALYRVLANLPQNADFADFFLAEIVRMEQLQAVFPALTQGTMRIEEMLQRVVSNKFYDDLNMGSENFVVSNFQYFFHRYPTQTELEEGKKMVEGFLGLVLQEAGYNKTDFVRIVFNSVDFREGRVIYLFRKYLFRDPNSEEIFRFSRIYKESDDYTTLVRSIFLTREFAGL